MCVRSVDVTCVVGMFETLFSPCWFDILLFGSTVLVCSCVVVAWCVVAFQLCLLSCVRVCWLRHTCQLFFVICHVMLHLEFACRWVNSIVCVSSCVVVHAARVPPPTVFPRIAASATSLFNNFDLRLFGNFHIAIIGLCCLIGNILCCGALVGDLNCVCSINNAPNTHRID